MKWASIIISLGGRAIETIDIEYEDVSDGKCIEVDSVVGFEPEEEEDPEDILP
ncbi:hypothetical protein SAMN05421780_101572 [Flexibacter flexilis DSM 6793]|uniref:Uncharacterized protein n=1 Tax=Flexibacter flexilis DSM 6793 TaxID=927664 RepID=A0A1I1E2H1_9BACT|nr:hypothetical protein SAMN05421780_101572 [Flexibacter flexilis DSM 6793]